MTTTFKYDKSGNILSKIESDYTLDKYPINTNKKDCIYSSTGRQDQLLSYDGMKFAYGEDGDPLKERHKGIAVERNQRGQVIKYNNVEFNYDINGNRTSKTAGSLTTKFRIIRGKLLRSTNQNHDLFFNYALDTIIGFRYNNISYSYLKNIAKYIKSKASLNF